jgi:hypothetical protein
LAESGCTEGATWGLSYLSGGAWIYIGMSFKNLQSRLNQHASGRRSGDQFCVYVSDRLVMKNLTDEQLDGISQGTYSLDHQIRNYILTELSYRYLLVPKILLLEL